MHYSAARCATTCRSRSYLFWRYPTDGDRGGEVRTHEQLVLRRRNLKARHGFRTHKLKGGVFRPDYEIEVLSRARRGVSLATALRFDPNGAWSSEDAIRFGAPDRGVDND